ncbi:MAG: phytanoyl-CoA hydroxylase [Litorivivens sp.]|jgi:phytanoyl-CoA hydroxylase
MSILRKSKIVYSLYNLFQRKKLERNEELYRRIGLKKHYSSAVSSRDFERIDPDVLAPSKEVQAAIKIKKDGLPVDIQEQIKDWSENGFAILPSFYSEETAEKINDEVDHLLDTGKVKWRYGNKIMFAIHQSKMLTELGSNSQLLDVLSVLTGQPVSLFQSINFKAGSQQRTHSDAIHMTTFPFGNMIAIWVALEDMTLENGALHYYPGSHKLPYVMNSDFDNIGSKFWLGPKDYSDYEEKIQEVLVNNPMQKKVFTAKKGDVLIWHANLLHGGEKVIDPKSTRKSVVYHYFADNSVAFHEITERAGLRLIQKH